jgi:hypothetical protein
MNAAERESPAARAGPLRPHPCAAGSGRGLEAAPRRARRPARVCLPLAALLLAGCAGPPPPEEWTAWRARRAESVAGTNGWTTLVGLHWLDEGVHELGADAAAGVRLPAGRAPGRAGTLTRAGRVVTFAAAPGVAAAVDGRPVTEAVLRSDAGGAPTGLRLGGVWLTVIERGERLGLRVRDPEAPARRDFAGLRTFPHDPAWRRAGRFEPASSPGELRVPDAAGGTQALAWAGDVVFGHAGATHRLAAVAEPGVDELFLIFTDATTGRATYPAGRFLYAPRPGPDGVVTLDFNRAYNPPCAFTPHATCPRPPPQNHLPFAVRAGERRPSGRPARPRGRRPPVPSKAHWKAAARLVLHSP